jgi:hypothetical protein
MKIYLDNEIEEYRKKVFLTSNYNEDVYDDVDSVIDALKAYGHTESNIRRAFVEKCIGWGLIEVNPYNEEDDF